MTTALVLLACAALQPLAARWFAKRPSVISRDQWTNDVLQADCDRLALAAVLTRTEEIES